MPEVFASAYAKSQIQNAEFLIESPLFGARYAISAGDQLVNTLTPNPYSTVTDIRLTIRSNGGSINVFGRGIPTDSQIHLIGVNPILFIGLILHTAMPPLAPGCLLQCNPSAQAVGGTPCIVCKDDGLTFKLCC